MEWRNRQIAPETGASFGVRQRSCRFLAETAATPNILRQGRSGL
jgi:hypothetical protein